MDDMVLGWFTNDLIVDPAALRPVPVPQLAPTVADMRAMIERVRAEEEANRRGVTFMCHPDHRDQVDRLLRQAAQQTAREHGPEHVRKWTLTVSRHVPKGTVISWLRHPNGKPADEFPPLNIVATS